MLNFFDAFKVLSNFKKLDLKWTGTWDGKPATVQMLQVAMGLTAKITVRFTEGGAVHSISATHVIKGGGADVIKFDSADVEKDDVDFQILLKFALPPYVLLRFNFEFTDRQGKPHVLVCSAKQKLPLPIG